MRHSIPLLSIMIKKADSRQKLSAINRFYFKKQKVKKKHPLPLNSILLYGASTVC